MLVSYLHKFKFKLHICLTETGFKRDALQSLVIDGFILHSSYSHISKKCGGVTIWIRDGTEAKSFDLSDFEICAIHSSRNTITLYFVVDHRVVMNKMVWCVVSELTNKNKI